MISCACATLEHKVAAAKIRRRLVFSAEPEREKQLSQNAKVNTSMNIQYIHVDLSCESKVRYF